MLYYTCDVCNCTKSSTEFRSLNKCKSCRELYLKAYRKQYYQLNKDKLDKINRGWTINNPEKADNIAKKTILKNKEKRYKKSREYHKLNRSQISKKEVERINSDINFKILKRLRTRLYVSIKSKGSIKHKSTKQLLGCNILELKSYLESKFLPTMTWENYGRCWHIDHIVPCSSFDLTQKEEQERCYNYTNLQPLFAFTTVIDGIEYIGNVNKGDKLIKD